MVLKNNKKIIDAHIILKNKTLCFILSIALSTKVFASTYTASTVVGTGTYNAVTLEINGTHWNTVNLGAPSSVVKDPTDNSIIFADTDHSAIRRSDATGAVSTILSGFGNTPPKFLTIDSTTGDIYGTNGHSIFKILKDYTSVYILATDSGSAPNALGSKNNPTTTYCLTNMASPNAGIAYDNGNKYIYFASGSGQIYQINISTTPYTVLAITSGFSCASAGLTLNKMFNKLYMINNASSVYKIYQIPVPAITTTAIGSLTCIAGGSGSSWTSQLGSLPLTATGILLSAPKQLAVDSAENVYVTESNYIGKIASGNISLFAGNNSSATLNTNLTSINGIFVDEGNAIFTTQGTSSNSYNLIQRIIQQGAVITLNSGKVITTNALNVPYYSTMNFSGDGTISISNNGMSYGKISLSGSIAMISTANALGSGGCDNKLTLADATLKASGTLGAATLSFPLTYSGTSRIDTNKNCLTFSSPFTSSNSWQNNLIFQGGGTAILNADNSSTLKGGIIVSDPGTVLSIGNNNELGWGIGQNNLLLTNYGTLLINEDITLSHNLSYQNTASIDTNGHTITLLGELSRSYSTDVLNIKGGGTATLKNAVNSISNSCHKHALKIVEGTTVALDPTGVNTYVNLDIGVNDGSNLHISKSGLTIASFTAS